MRALQVVFLVSLILTQTLGQSNHIVKESSASASSSAAADDPAPAPAPVPAPVPQPVPVPPVFPGVGFGKGFGLHKSLDFNIGAGAGAGASPFGGLFPGLFGGVPPAAGPGLGVGVPVGATDAPIPVDPGTGGLPVAGPGYLGSPFPFLGPSYVPYSWLGSALGAKGDLLFPVVIFIFVVVGVWTVVQFLLGLIVPLIAAKFEVGEKIVKAKTGGRQFRSIEQMHEDRLNSVTAAVMDALEKTNELHQHNFGIPEVQQKTQTQQAPPLPQAQDHQQNQTGKPNVTEQHGHPLFTSLFA